MDTCDGGSGPLCVCFNQLSSIQQTYYGQYNELATSWELFRRVEIYNSNVALMRSQGDKSVTYWQFANNQEKSYYNQGGILFATYLNYTSTVRKI